MPKVISSKKTRSLAFFLALVCLLAVTTGFSQTEPDQNQLSQIHESFAKQNESLKTLKASLRIGIPHPSAPLIQWTDALLAWQKNPEFLYLKGHKPLVPLYFILKSLDRRFWFYLVRPYTVYYGANEVLEREIDLDVKMIPQDILIAIQWPEISEDESNRSVHRNAADEEEWVIKAKDGEMLRRIVLDGMENPKFTVEYNEFGFPKLEITKENWQLIRGGGYFPLRIKIKRVLSKID